VSIAIMIPLCFLLFKKAIDQLGEHMKKEKKEEHELTHLLRKDHSEVPDAMWLVEQDRLQLVEQDRLH
jgi:hypothetical protein